jgi:hypothetical protein
MESAKYWRSREGGTPPYVVIQMVECAGLELMPQ